MELSQQRDSGVIDIRLLVFQFTLMYYNRVSHLRNNYTGRANRRIWLRTADQSAENYERKISRNSTPNRVAITNESNSDNLYSLLVICLSSAANDTWVFKSGKISPVFPRKVCLHLSKTVPASH